MSSNEQSAFEPQQFALLGVRPDILSGLRELGFETPTPVQEKVIPSLLLGSGDLVAQSQTGTGKTAAFAIPLIQLTNIACEAVQGLVLCPTRELCVQVCRDIQAIARHTRGLRCTAVYGGASFRDQLRDLKRGAHIVVATPGRLLDMLERRAVKLGGLHTLVLDEADEMLNMGFRDAIDAIVAQTPDNRQTLLFSATMSREVKTIAGNYMGEPESITVGTANSAADNVTHEYYVVEARDRYRALKRVVDACPTIYGIVFCRTRVETQEVADQLIQDGYDAEALHGELSQSQRDFVMNKFRRRNLQLLVATDVAARGLDVDDLTHVINYNLPDEDAIYTHRCGRTGRAGRTGCSATIVHPREHHRIRQLQRLLGVRFERKSVPSGREICEQQLHNFITGIREVQVDESELDRHLESVVEQLADLDRETLIRRFAAVQLNRLLGYYKDAPDLNVTLRPTEREPRGARGKRRGRPSFASMTLNVGHDDGITPNRIIGRINQVTRNRDITVGRISVRGGHTLVEIDDRHVDEACAAFEGSNVNGKRVRVNTGTGRSGSKSNRTEAAGAAPSSEQSESRVHPIRERQRKRLHDRIAKLKRNGPKRAAPRAAGRNQAR